MPVPLGGDCFRWPTLRSALPAASSDFGPPPRSVQPRCARRPSNLSAGRNRSTICREHRWKKCVCVCGGGGGEKKKERKEKEKEAINLSLVSLSFYCPMIVSFYYKRSYTVTIASIQLLTLYIFS